VPRALPGVRAAVAVALLAITLVAAVLLAPRAAFAHGALRRSLPSDRARLTTVPTELRLVFTERPELAVTRVQLLGPARDTIVLGILRLEERTTVVASIVGALRAGAYTVEWQVVGRDGHPVRGTFGFSIAAEATGLAPDSVGLAAAPAADTATTTAVAPSAPDEPTASFDAESPVYAAIRWAMFVGLLLVIGTAAFRWTVMHSVRRRGAISRALQDDILRRAADVGLAAAALLLVTVLVRVAAQLAATHGEMSVAEHAPSLILRTGWGNAWLLQAGATLLAAVGFLAARRARGWGWMLAGVASLALALTPALAGHAAASVIAPVTIAADTLHVLGASAWLGGLALIVLAGLPGALAMPAERGSAVAQMVRAFSPFALLFAGTVVLTGVISAWTHLGSVGALLGSSYGRVLLLKLAALLPLVAVALYNWRRLRPALGDDAGAERLRRSASAELLVGLLVLAVTAVLVATPPAADG
jgi:copper transport protein